MKKNQRATNKELIKELEKTNKKIGGIKKWIAWETNFKPGQLVQYDELIKGLIVLGRTDSEIITQVKLKLEA